MITLCIIIFIIISLIESNNKCHDAERDYDYEVEERRHREVLKRMDSYKVEPPKTVSKKRIRKRTIKDSVGNMMSEEITEDM